MRTSIPSKESVLQHGITDRGFPDFKIGDQIRVDQVIVDGDKERIQAFEGNVIAFHANGIATTFIVRRVADGYGVEKIFPYYSPLVRAIKIIRQVKIRRAKLYYLRGIKGRKNSKLKDKIFATVAAQSKPKVNPESSQG